MLNNASGIDHIYIACGYTDLRSGIDRLAALVQSSFKLDPYQNSLFPVSYTHLTLPTIA